MSIEQTAQRGTRLNSPAANPSESRHLLHFSEDPGLQDTEGHGTAYKGQRPTANEERAGSPAQLYPHSCVRTCWCLPAPPLLLQNPPGRVGQSAPEGRDLRARNLTKKTPY